MLNVETIFPSNGFQQENSTLLHLRSLVERLWFYPYNNPCFIPFSFTVHFTDHQVQKGQIQTIFYFNIFKQFFFLSHKFCSRIVYLENIKMQWILTLSWIRGLDFYWDPDSFPIVQNNILKSLHSIFNHQTFVII